MRADKTKVINEIWDDARIDSFLHKEPLGDEPAEFDAWVEARSEKYSPSQISAFVLQKMKETAEIKRACWCVVFCHFQKKMRNILRCLV